MSKNRSAAGITNIVQYDANKNITFVSGSTTLLTVSSSGALTTTSTITAQTLVVQTITSSVNFVTGSTKFGAIVSNTHQFTGSLNVTGSLSVVTTGTEFQVTDTGVNLGNVLTDSHVISGSLRVNPNGLFVSSSGNVGIGTTNPTTKFDLSGSIGNFQIASSGAEIFLTRNDNNDILATGGTTSGITIGAQSYVRFSTGTGYTERVRINSSGSVTIGTTSLTGWSANDKVLKIQGSLGVSVVQAVSSDAGCALWLYSGAGSSDHPSVIYLKDLRFGSATDLGTGGYNERMRITSGGNLLFTQGVSTGVTDTRFLMIAQGTTSSTYAMVIKQSNNSTNLFLVRDDGLMQTGTASGSPYNNTSGAAANMVVNSLGTLERSTSSIKYKKDIRNYDKGLAEVLQMRPVYYKGIGESDGEKQYAGLIAEEIHDLGLTEFVQYAEDGTPDALAYQNMITLMTKAIQELKAEIDALKA